MTRTATRRTARRRARRRTALVVGTAVALLAAGNVAYAYWSATGTGTAAAGTATAMPLGVAAVTNPTATLYPGKTEDLGLLLSNDNPYPVSLTTLTAATVASSDPAACPASHVVLPAAVTTALGTGGYTLPTPFSVAAGATAVPASLVGFLTLATSAPDGCQARTFTVSLSFSGTQAA